MKLAQIFAFSRESCPDRNYTEVFGQNYWSYHAINCTVNSSDSIACRGIAQMAPQQGLGILPQRWIRSRSDYIADSYTHWPPLDFLI